MGLEFLGHLPENPMPGEDETIHPHEPSDEDRDPNTDDDVSEDAESFLDAGPPWPTAFLEIIGGEEPEPIVEGLSDEDRMTVDVMRILSLRSGGQPFIREVPPEFWSAYSSGPFERCIECGCSLLEDGAPLYSIEKVMKAGETILEFAMCMGCAKSTSREISEESRERIDEFLSGARIVSTGLVECSFCGELQDEEEGEFERFTLARYGSMIGPGHVVCHRCQSALEGLLSVETRRSMDEFVEKNFPGVPEGLILPVAAL